MLSSTVPHGGIGKPPPGSSIIQKKTGVSGRSTRDALYVMMPWECDAPGVRG